MKLEERLNEIIEEKESKIEELENEVERLKSQFDLSRLNWQMHSIFKNDDFNKQMPYPRLEMRLRRTSKDNWYSIEWIYGLVYKHYSDTHCDTLLFIPFSATTSNGGDGTFESRYRNGKLELPRRDGFHIYAESKVFGLPAFIVCHEKNIFQPIEIEGFYHNDKLLKMKSETSSEKEK
jgi:hypothetical protein